MVERRAVRRATVRGAVQGVGFRPFVYRLAAELGLTGWVRNGLSGVEVAVEGDEARVSDFLHRLTGEAPAVAVIDDVEVVDDVGGYEDFRILPSAFDGVGGRLLPDLATCADCVRELFDVADRRHRHPFINCTSCGPRYTIATGLPYDRSRTTMAGFSMCAACAAEYADPCDRRFHAQPTACHACGPVLSLLTSAGGVVARGAEALAGAVGALASGQLVAVRSLGGFQLLVDATDAAAVGRLRARKDRPHKPLAIVVPDVAAAARLASVDEAEAALLGSPRAPIVLLRLADGGEVLAPNVAPDVGVVGVMLAYTPVHHLLLAELGRPLVATSANRRGEPLCVGDGEVVEQLGEVVELILTHDRAIARRADDSVARVVSGRPLLLRRARGYVPDPIDVPWVLRPTVAAGGHQKVVVGSARGRRVTLGPHLGDLDGEATWRGFEAALTEAAEGLGEGWTAAVDAHPDYPGARCAAARSGGAVEVVFHHHAHAVACLAEHGQPGPALVATFDGTGYGPDGTIWGGELLVATLSGFERVAHLAPFRLPGGTAAVVEPRRSALGWLAASVGVEVAEARMAGHFEAQELRVLSQLLRGGVASPVTTSMGRLFDAVSCLVGLGDVMSWEGQGGAMLEAAAMGSEVTAPFAPVLTSGPPPWTITFPTLVEAVLRPTEPAGVVARRFHLGVAEAVVEVARRVGLPAVGLTGGCFQNALLATLCEDRLKVNGFQVLTHRLVPPNDGGLALGQAVIGGVHRSLE